jgi:hypothetical protein
VAATPDLLLRDFTAVAAAIKLVGDISYIATWQGRLYPQHSAGALGTASFTGLG